MDIKLSPPWQSFFKEVCELFSEDKEVTPVYNDEKKALTLIVTSYEKAQALKQIFPKTKSFGKIIVDIEIKYQGRILPIAEVYKAAFNNNPAFKYTYSFDTGENRINYVVFEKKVVQYWNDDMSDPHGVTSTLYANIANNIFGDKDGVIFSTDSEKNNKWTEKYYTKHATPEEIEMWEMYNGKGSYESNKPVRADGEEVNINSPETFKKLFTDYKDPNN